MVASSQRRPWTSEPSSGEHSGAIMTPLPRSSGAALARLDAAARLILRDPELARDAVQEALIRAWRTSRASRPGPVRRLASSPRPSTPVSTLVRRRRRRPIEVELIPLDGPRPRRPAARSPTAISSTRRSPASIPSHRALVALHYFLGMPLPEVAASLGIPTRHSEVPAAPRHRGNAAGRRGARPRPGAVTGGQVA